MKCRISKKPIGNICRGLYLDARHIENLFKYLTRTILTPTIEKNFKQQMGEWLFYLKRRKVI